MKLDEMKLKNTIVIHLLDIRVSMLENVLDHIVIIAAYRKMEGCRTVISGATIYFLQILESISCNVYISPSFNQNLNLQLNYLKKEHAN